MWLMSIIATLSLDFSSSPDRLGLRVAPSNGEYGDERLICNYNLVGTVGVWYSVAFQQVAARLHCEADPFFCPAIPTSSSYVVLLDEGRALGARYRRTCAEGFVRYAGDDEVVCGFEGVWKTKTGTGSNLRNVKGWSMLKKMHL